jgi:dolichol-phosphate mannosyltransferase
MTNNFIWNNRITYRDRCLHGWGFVRGLLSFFAVCGVGLVGNVGVASWINGPHDNWQVRWWISSLVGVLMATLWNYAVSSVVTWKK